MAKRFQVIADAGPLIAVAKLNVLALLKRLYGAVMIPQTVYEEVVTEGLARGYADAATVKLFWEQQKWAPVIVNVEEIPEDLRRLPLDPGERDSLFLAGKSKRTLLLVDEELAREVARRRGIRIKGLLAFLLRLFVSNYSTWKNWSFCLLK